MVAGLLAAGGCTLQDSGTPPPTATTTPGRSDTDLDLDLVGEARTALLEMLDLARRTSLLHVGLAPALTPLVDLHTAHDALLAESSPDPSPAPTGSTVAPRSRPALALVRRREAALQAELAALAGRARSGPLARLLASMSAAVAQHVARLPAERKEAA